MDNQRVYFVIDMKSFYASCECSLRGLDPYTTNLAVADPERTEKTICLAISINMKKTARFLFSEPIHLSYT